MAHRSWPTYVRPWPNMTLSQPSASTTRWYALNGIRPQRPGLFTPSSMSQRSSSSPAISSSCVRATTATGAVTTQNFPAVKASTATLFIHSNGQKTSTTQANVWSSLARERPPSPSFLRLPVMLSTSRCCNAPLPGWSLDPTSTRLRQRSSGSFLNDLPTR